MSLREKIAERIYAAMQWACDNNCGDSAPAWVEGGNSFAQTEAHKQADAILSTVAESVPPLVWKSPSERHLENGVCHGSCERIAYVNDGYLHWYRIYPTGRNEWRWVEQFRMTYIGGNEADDPPLCTAEAAMAAAQSDYSSRILKAAGISQ